MNPFSIYLELFYKKLDEIENYIDLIDDQKLVKMELKKLSESDDDFKHTKKYDERLGKIITSPLQYNAVIISMYGAYEQFIDDIITAYISKILEEAENYDKLPKKMKDKYYKKACEFLTNSQRFNNYNLDCKDIIKSLNDCYNINNKQNIVDKLIVSHGGNLRIGQITELMNDLGIENSLDKILFSEIYKDYYSEENEILRNDVCKEINKKKKEEKDGISKENIFFGPLNKLIDERNIISHGWKSDNRIAYNDIKEKIILFLKGFCKIIEMILLEAYYKYIYALDKMIEFDELINVYNSRIICINNKSAKLKINDYIFGIDKKNIFHILKICNLRVEPDDKESIKENNIEVGIEVDYSIKRNWKFYYLE